MTISRHIRPDKFGIPSAMEIDDGFIDMIVAGSKSVGEAQTHGTLMVLSGVHDTLGGWTASRPADAAMWVFTSVSEPTPGNLIAYVSAVELDENGEVPEHLSREIFDGDEPAKLETGVEFKPGDTVRLIAPDMVVQTVAGEDITCVRADAPGSMSGTYPAASLGRIAPAGAA